MANILIRGVPDAVLRVFRAEAQRKGHSVQAELRAALVQQAGFGPQDRKEIIAAMRKIRSKQTPMSREEFDKLWDEHRKERDERTDWLVDEILRR